MKVAIIGVGFTGLSAAKKLAESGIEVTVFEKEKNAGGLASGFTELNWNWSIEFYYHHWFTGDRRIKKLAKDIGHEIIYKRPKTSTLREGKIIQLDSPITLLTFKGLPFIERLRTGFILAYLKFTPFWKPLEKITAKDFLIKYMGKISWEILWEPLFVSKFKSYADKIPASWFWARIKTRSSFLGYPVFGYQSFIDSLVTYLKKTGKVQFIFGSDVKSIKRINGKISVDSPEKIRSFDAVICTLDFKSFGKICQGLPSDYNDKINSFKSIGAVNLLLSLNEKFLIDGTYWLNINDEMPFLVVVEHTNFMDNKNYAGERLLYVGNYLDHSDKYFNYSEKELLDEFMPHLKKINPSFGKKWINKVYLFKSRNSQPIIPLNYSKIMPGFKTPVDGVYLANLQQTNPYDRGTEYAAAVGEKVADMIIKNG